MDVVIATPLRLAKVAKKADLSSVQFLVFDEADKLLDAGFLRQMDRIVAACTHPRRVRPHKTLSGSLAVSPALSSTYSPEKGIMSSYLLSEQVPQQCAGTQTAGFFSATLPEKAEELARSMLKQPVRVTVGERNSAASSVRQRLVFVGSEAGKLMGLRDLLRTGLRPPILVFTNSKERCSALHRWRSVCLSSLHAFLFAARQAFTGM
jgi:ATP-dependent RNA helicase DDX52/ROK1